MRLRFLAVPAALGLLVLGGIAGCASSSGSTNAGRCLAPLTAGSPTQSATAAAVATSASMPSTALSPADSAATGRTLADLALGCLDGSGDVKLSAVGRPMIVSFWATWCQPCRAELPHVESFAQAAGGAVAVVGVDTGDDRGKATSFVSDFGLTFPMVSDPRTALLKTVASPALPTLLFVAADGRIAYTYSSNKLDDATLRRLTTKYLGVRVAG
jgi:thiol-disulfide isomerase/thioredoxin